jgi:hypothetical protein
MAEARHVDGVGQQLHADETAAARQLKAGEIGIFVQRQIGHGRRGVGILDLSALDEPADGEEEAGVEGMGGA